MFDTNATDVGNSFNQKHGVVAGVDDLTVQIHVVKKLTPGSKAMKSIVGRNQQNTVVGPSGFSKSSQLQRHLRQIKSMGHGWCAAGTIIRFPMSPVPEKKTAKQSVRIVGAMASQHAPE